MSVGVLNQKQIFSLINEDPTQIKCESSIMISEKDIDPSAIDLPLGDKYWIMEASCRVKQTGHVTDLINKYGGPLLMLEKGTVLKPKTTYLIALPWSLKLLDNICARATAKSSVGRLDALVRLVADKETEFETVGLGNECNIYLEVRPNTFPLVVSPGNSLSQVRFLRGEEHHCTVSIRMLEFEDDPPLVDKAAVPIKSIPGVGDSESILLRLDLDNDEELGFAGFVAKTEKELESVDPIDPSKKDYYNPKDYWEPVETVDDGASVRIENDRFYIFRSKERFRLPAHLAVDCRAMSESLGDIRIHYAGFAHPFFGLNNGRDNGAPLIFEVRGYQFDTILHDETALAKVFFRRMAADAKQPPGDKYSKQELKLSKCFKKWT